MGGKGGDDKPEFEGEFDFKGEFDFDYLLGEFDFDDFLGEFDGEFGGEFKPKRPEGDDKDFDFGDDKDFGGEFDFDTEDKPAKGGKGEKGSGKGGRPTKFLA